MKELFALMLSFLILISCQKEHPTELQPDYLPLAIGNYWIYQYFFIDSLNQVTEVTKYDSIAISRDTIIRDKQYYVFEGTVFSNERKVVVDILRDSSGYLVDNYGRIRFSYNNFTDTIYYQIVTCCENDTMFTISYKMECPDYPVTVPAGTFNVLNYQGTYYSSINILENFDNPIYLNTYYADKVGKVLEMTAYSSYHITEKRLIRYHIQE